MKKMALLLTIVFTICIFAGCSSNNAGASAGEASSKTTPASSAAESQKEDSSKAASQSEADLSAGEAGAQAQGGASAQEPPAEQSILYIGMEDYFQEYPVDIPRGGFQNSDEVDAYLESLIGKIAELTGWNLACSVNSYKAITVQFSLESFVVPEVQKEEFFTFEAPQLIQTILDSVQRTIRENLDGGENLDIYFSTLDDQPLEFPDIGMHVPMEEPYHGLVDD